MSQFVKGTIAVIYFDGSSPEFVGEFGQFCPSFPPREEGVVSTEQRRDLRFELFP